MSLVIVVAKDHAAASASGVRFMSMSMSKGLTVEGVDRHRRRGASVVRHDALNAATPYRTRPSGAERRLHLATVAGVAYAPRWSGLDRRALYRGS
jgi:hypothetical protein